MALLNNFCFHVYAQKWLFIGENCNVFIGTSMVFFLTKLLAAPFPVFSVHRAGSQLKISSWACSSLFHSLLATYQLGVTTCQPIDLQETWPGKLPTCRQLANSLTWPRKLQFANLTMRLATCNICNLAWQRGWQLATWVYHRILLAAEASDWYT